MADNQNTTQNDFILSLIGTLDEATTRSNVQNALDKISTSVSLKSNKAKNKITIFDKTQLEKDGVAYLNSAKDIESQVSEIFKNLGTDFTIKKTFADDGSVSKFVATIYEGTKAIQTLNFEAAKFTDNTVGFRQVGGTSTTEKMVLREIETIKSENEQINIQEVLLGKLSQAKQQLNDGSISSDSLKLGKLNEDIRLLENQIKEIDFSKIGTEGEFHLNSVTNAIMKAVEAEHTLHNVMMDEETGVFNVPALEKAGIQYYDTAVGIVQKVKSELEDKGFTPKIDNIIRNSEGQIVSFNAQIKNSSGVIDNLNYSMVQLTDGYRVFDGYMSSFGKQVDNSSQEYAKSLERQTKDLSKARTDLDDLMTKFLTGYGSKVLSGDDRANNIFNKLVEAEDLINSLNSNAGMNSTAQMDGLKSFISGIKKEADEYVNLENVERKQAEQQKKDDEEKIKNTQSQLSSLKKYKEEVNSILNDYVRVNGKNLITNDKYSTEIKDKAVGLLSQIYSMNQNAGLNTPEQMSNINDVIKGLKSEADEYYRINNAQKTLINNQTKEVDAIQKKVSAITGKYLDSSGNNQLLNTENIKAANEEIGKVYKKIGELRANTGRKSYDFEANLSVLENMYNTLDKNVKGYYKLETEQKKSDELTQKQSKSIQQYLIDIQKIKNTALNANSGKALLNESNIKTVTTELSKAENILNAILKGHTDGKIIPTKTFDELDIRLSKVNSEISRLKDEETVAMASDKTVQSQLNALNRVEQKVKDIRIAYEDSFANKNSNVTFGLSLSDVNNELDRLKDKAGSITEEEMRNLNNLTNGLKRTASMLAENEKEQTKNSELWIKQSKELSAINEEIKKIENTALNKKSGSALFDEDNINKTRSSLDEIKNIYDILYSGHNNKEVLQTESIDLANIKLKELKNNISNMSDEERLSRSISKGAESQLDALNRYDQKVKDIFSKYSKNGKNELFDTDNINNFNKLLANTITEISRLQQKAGSVTAEEARNLSNMVNGLQRTASSYYQREENERKLAEEASKTAKAYDQQKYKLESLSQEARKLYDSTFNGKNNLVNEKNITDAQKKIKNLSLFIDGLYTKHNKGDLIPEDAFIRFDLKLKETTQDIKNMRDNESLQKSLIGNVESQLNALNTIENKVLRIQSIMLDNGKIRTPSYVSDISNQVATIGETITALMNKAGNITDAESRSLVNMVSDLQRVADEYVRIDAAQQQYDKSLSTQAKDLKNIYNQLELINRTVLSPNANSNLKDSSHLVTVRNQYSDLIELVYRLDKEVSSGKVVNAEDLQRANDLLSKMQINIKVFKDEETLVKNATKSMESQLNTLNNFEQKTNKLRANYLTQNGSSTLIDTNHIKAVETELGNLTSKIESMRNTTDTNNEASYRELLNQYNALELLAGGYANLEKSQTKNEESLRRQANTLADYKRGITDLYNTNIDQTVKGSLKNQDNINNISKSLMDVNTEISNLQKLNANGEVIPIERIDALTNAYKNLGSQISFARGQEGLDDKISKDTQSQINKFAEMERALDKFRAKYYGDASGTKLSDQMHIDEVNDKLAVLNEKVTMFKNNAGNITDAQINEYKDLENELNITADGYAKLEAIQKKDIQTVDEQKYILKSYALELQKIRDTSLNPNSVFNITESENIQKVTDNVEKLEQRYNKMMGINGSNKIIDKGYLKEADLILKEIYQDINIISKEEASSQKFNVDINSTETALYNLESELKRIGKYEGDIKEYTEELIDTFYKITTPQELSVFKTNLEQFDVIVKNLIKDEQALASDEQLQQKLNILSSQVNGYMQQNSKAAVMFKSDFDKLRQGIENARSPEEFAKLQNDFKLLQQNINNAGQAGLTFGQRISGAVKKFMMWTGMTNVVMYLVRSIKQMVTNVKELDSSMISLKKVTNETDVAYKNMFDSAVEKAKELNTSVKNIIDSTAEFAKLGFNTEQAQGLAEIANVYANVSEISAESATKTLVSTINGFKDLTVDNAWDIADIINNVSNKFAASGEDLGEILQRSSAALSEANNDLNESIALGTVAQTINVDASRVGTALKTLSLRIRGATATLEEEGLDTEGMIETTADLRKLILASAGVDILEEDQKTFKSTYQILLEISKVWGNINDLERSAMLQALGGIVFYRYVQKCA